MSVQMFGSVLLNVTNGDFIPDKTDVTHGLTAKYKTEGFPCVSENIFVMIPA